MTITRTDLEQMQRALSADIATLRRDIDRVDAKLDTKPSIAALYQAVVTLAFGLSAAITGTVVVLNNLGLSKH